MFAYKLLCQINGNLSRRTRVTCPLCMREMHGVGGDEVWNEHDKNTHWPVLAWGNDSKNSYELVV